MRLVILTALVLLCSNPSALATDLYEAYESFAKGDTKTAERVFLQTLSKPAIKGTPDVQKPMAILFLNMIYAGRRDFAKQELILKKSAQMEREHNWDRAKTLSSLASCYDDQHKYQEAEKYFKKALHENELRHGKNNLNKIPILLNLSTFYTDRGRFQEAYNCILEGLELKIALRLGETAQFAELRDRSPSILVAAGEYERAEKAFEERLEAWKKMDEPTDSIHTADLYKDLAEAKGGLGKFAESESLFRKALEIDLAKYPENASELDTNRMNIARALIEQGKLDESESFVKIAIENYKKRKSQFNPSYGTALAVQASIYQKRGEAKPALKLINEALSIHQKINGEQSPRVIRDLSIKAEILRDLKMKTEASKQLQRAMSISKNLLGKEHPLTLKIQKQYESFTKRS